MPPDPVLLSLIAHASTRVVARAEAFSRSIPRTRAERFSSSDTKGLAMAEPAYLTFNDGEGAHSKVELDAQVFRIGRLEENDLVLDNPYISRFHAQIVNDNSSYLLNDLESTSGSFVNDERIEHRPLREGDQIRFGQEHGIELVFHAAQAEDQSEPSGPETAFKPIRLIDPEEARFIHIEKLPPTRDLASETVDRLRALYEFTTELER